MKYCHECKHWEQIGMTMFGECKKIEEFFDFGGFGGGVGIKSDFGCILIEDYE